jgi:NAD+ dependent glucose-6-phosphate dehydrogenase
MERRRTVVLTGATGNIGRKLWRHLEGIGCEIRPICLNPGGDLAVTTADLSRSDLKWTDRFAGADAVIHLAARLAVGPEWPPIIGANVDAVLQVYLAAARHGVPRVIFASSVWAQYGYRHTRDPLTPSLPPRPTNPYGTAKFFGERVGQCFFDQYGIGGVAFRIGANRPGPENRPDHAMTRGDWEQSCWVSDRDLCQGFARAVTADYQGFAVLNLVSDIAGSRWQWQTTRDVLGYVPEDKHTVCVGPKRRLQSAVARIGRVTIPSFLERRISRNW